MLNQALDDAVRHGLGPGPGAALDCEYVPAVGSTNTELKLRLARGELARPTLLYTGAQLAGRGTRGREWIMQPGLDIAFTLAASPPAGLLADTRLSLAVAACVALGAEQATGLSLGVQWPNDVLAGAAGEQRKCGGILLETAESPVERRRWLFAGVGLNVNSAAAMFPQTLAGRLATLGEAAGRVLDRAGLILAVAKQLAGLLLEEGHGTQPASLVLDGLVAEWCRRDLTPGKTYLLCRGQARVPVSAVSVDPATGHLLCRDGAGQAHVVASYTELEPAP
jgi:biotin-(acetyl-CoA carboxylase) ligase